MEETYPDIYNTINAISHTNFDEFLTAAGNNEVVVYIGRPTCSDCNLFEPSLIDFINSNSLNNQISYLNTSEIREDDHAWSEFKSKYNIIYTPTIAIFQNNQLKEKIEWTPENGININAVSTWFKQNKLF